MALIECVPNISEGRRLDIVADIAAAVRRQADVRLLDCSSDPAHNRSVLTLVGSPHSIKNAILALFEGAVETIDMRIHRGEHPRLGAVDVVPFIPIEGATMEECVDIARQTAAAVARRFNVPVYLYQEAATHPRRKNLEDIRRGQFEGLSAKMTLAEWAPDYGPATPHPTAGVTVIGARLPLIAYNINLATDRIEIARQIAAAVRESGGGLPFVKALGMRLEDRGIVQVSMNLTNYKTTSMFQVFEMIRREAGRHGVDILSSEIVGLVPADALAGGTPQDLRLVGFRPDQVLETRLHDVS